MKKLLAVTSTSLLLVMLVASSALAVQNAVTPSTNDTNRANGWAHVDVTPDAGSATLTFVSTRVFYSCFEYRTDGDTTQQTSPTNPNPAITDGRYPYRCVNNSTTTVTVPANGYVEVRMVFGAETDERFDWTRFDVLPKCSPTGFVRDGINLTAAQIGGAVTGTLDATGCNIGAYNPTSVAGATIFGASYFGVVANGIALDVKNSTIRNIGDVPFSGSQHGVAVFYTGSTGTISGNTVSLYQKGGIVARDGAKVTIRKNVVVGAGRVNYIAQNGIQVSYGASAIVARNTIRGNYYTPKSYVACGLLFYQAAGVRAYANLYRGNERNLCNVGRGGGRFNR
jgi:Right handed beta helix region